jgi:hypothetical protein
LKIDDLGKMWGEDLNIDETAIASEAARIPVLHNKYYMIYVQEVLRLKMLRTQLTTLTKDKTEYYNGSLDPAELKKRGWAPNSLRILKADIPKYVESDNDVIDMSLKISLAETLVKYLEDIIKQISNRNFILKNILEWNKFQSGSM